VYDFDFDRQFEFGMDALLRGLEPLRKRARARG
jgi:hypothetical protein